MPELVVGFDLDLTLIDSRDRFAAALDAASAELGLSVDSAALAASMGPPLSETLHGRVPDDRIGELVDRFRVHYAADTDVATSVLPGAREAIAAVHREGGSAVVVTGKFAPNAQDHLDQQRLPVDALVGGLWGSGKGSALRELGATAYVGDHLLDVAAARSAGATSVSVLTGTGTRDELEAAGTDVVLEDLTEFPRWLDDWLLPVRLADLRERLEALGSVMVAFSGGADSAFLLAAAVRALGADRVAAATAYSGSLAHSEREPARDFARSLGVRLLTPRTAELDRAGYRANDGDRCFFCKAELLDVLGPLARRHGFAAVATGTNADDARAGFRPGIRAADERGAVTPLRDAGLSKRQIRLASRDWGLPTWDKPAAACLSSRIAYGITITPARLARVERAEAAAREALLAAGVPVANLRVRDLGELARIEIDRELVATAAALPDLLERVRATGFAEAEVDPLGFRSGSMNELLVNAEGYR